MYNPKTFKIMADINHTNTGNDDKYKDIVIKMIDYSKTFYESIPETESDKTETITVHIFENNEGEFRGQYLSVDVNFSQGVIENIELNLWIEEYSNSPRLMSKLQSIGIQKNKKVYLKSDEGKAFIYEMECTDTRKMGEAVYSVYKEALGINPSTLGYWISDRSSLHEFFNAEGLPIKMPKIPSFDKWDVERYNNHQQAESIVPTGTTDPAEIIGRILDYAKPFHKSASESAHEEIKKIDIYVFEHNEGEFGGQNLSVDVNFSQGVIENIELDFRLEEDSSISNKTFALDSLNKQGIGIQKNENGYLKSEDKRAFLYNMSCTDTREMGKAIYLIYKEVFGVDSNNLGYWFSANDNDEFFNAVGIPIAMPKIKSLGHWEAVRYDSTAAAQTTTANEKKKALKSALWYAIIYALIMGVVCVVIGAIEGLWYEILIGIVILIIVAWGIKKVRNL